MFPLKVYKGLLFSTSLPTLVFSSDIFFPAFPSLATPTICMLVFAQFTDYLFSFSVYFLLCVWFWIASITLYSSSQTLSSAISSMLLAPPSLFLFFVFHFTHCSFISRSLIGVFTSSVLPYPIFPVDFEHMKYS